MIPWERRHPQEVANIVPTFREAANIPRLAERNRYAPGGHIDQTWSRWRVLKSRVATTLALPLVTCSDPMAGFFATDRRVLPDLQRLKPIDYEIALELMARGRLQFKQIPIDFCERSKGSSKTNWRQQVNFLRHLYIYRLHSGTRVIEASRK